MASPLERFSVSLKTARCAFTLIELLVSMAVLTLMVAMVAQLTNSAAHVTTASNQHIDTDSQARIAFSCMDNDFRGMINRSDVDCFFIKNAGASGGASDAFYFYSQAPGYFSNNNGERSSNSFIGYRVANHQFTSSSDMALYPDYELERVGAALNYEGVGVPSRSQVTHLLINNLLPVKETTITHPTGLAAFIGGVNSTWDGDFGAGSNASDTGIGNTTSGIADSVFRMEFCFLVKDATKYGNRSFVVPVSPGNMPWMNTEFAGTKTNAANVTMRQFHSDVAAVVVTIAVLDPRSRALVTPTMLANAAKALPDGDDPTVAQVWVKSINDGTFKTASALPQLAASQVRVYQRFFYLNSN